MNEGRMMQEDTVHGEVDLDPSDWEGVRILGRQMVDDMVEYLRTVRERPVWRPIPDEVAARFREPLPRNEAPVTEVYDAFKKNVLPYPTGNIHPRFWGWVMGNGTVTAMLSEMLAAGINLNQGGGVQAGSLVESQVISWCKEMLGFPESASGLLVSGGSMANLVGLTVARNSRAGFDVRADGLGSSSRRLQFYASSEVHSSIQKSLELLGLGQKALRLVPVLPDFTIDMQQLRGMVRADRADGHVPVCVIGCAGTVSTGATDPLEALADFCMEEQLWFHVDGAFGALAALSPNLRQIVRGLERADSIAFDMHKWMYLPYEVGCALVRDAEVHRRSFSLTPDYLEHTTRGIGGGDVWFSDYGVQLSRGFRALKVWMSFKEHGIEKFGRLIQQNVDQAKYLENLVRSTPGLQLLAPVPLNIVCFRYTGGLSNDKEIDQLNKELLLRLHEGGVVAPSYTIVNGKYALRACITNHRSRREDFDLLLREVLRQGRILKDRPEEYLNRTSSE